MEEDRSFQHYAATVIRGARGGTRSFSNRHTKTILKWVVPSDQPLFMCFIVLAGSGCPCITNYMGIATM